MAFGQMQRHCSGSKAPKEKLTYIETMKRKKTNQELIVVNNKLVRYITM